MRIRTSARVVLASLLLGSPAFAQATRPAGTPEERTQRVIDAGLAYLKAQQKPDGAFAEARAGVAVSALVLKALSQDPAQRDAEPTRKGYTFLLGQQLESGGIYKDTWASYSTSISISALAAANNPDYRDEIDRAVAYLRTLQWQAGMTLPAGRTLGPADPELGGWGYGSKGRPDGSNTAFALDALKEAGVSASDPAFQAAAAFITRNQNLASNGQPHSKGLKDNGDGGFIYSLHQGGESFAGSYEEKDESGSTVKRFHSYGSMTYAGLKSLLYAGIAHDDPRVVAAHRWITERFSLTENPGMRNAGPDNAADGLYYYYHVLARSLRAFGEPAVATPEGSKDWRLELLAQLEQRQLPDGSWVGGKAYMETNPTLVTAYSVLAAQELLADLKRQPPVSAK